MIDELQRQLQHWLRDPHGRDVGLTNWFARFNSRAKMLLASGADTILYGDLNVLKFVKAKLRTQGVDLQIKVFTDCVQPNLGLGDKQLDANYFQHKPYLDGFNKDHGAHVVPVPGGNVHVEPFGAYSRKIKRIAELRDGAIVAIPNDPSNSGRALVLLQKQGLLKL